MSSVTDKDDSKNDQEQIENEQVDLQVENIWESGLFWFKDREDERAFLDYFYKYLPITVKLCALVMFPTNIVFIVLDVFSFLSDRNVIIIILAASRILNFLFISTIALAFFIPKFKNANKIWWEIALVLLLTAFIISVSQRQIFSDDGPAFITTLLGISFVLFKPRTLHLFGLSIFATILHAAFSLPINLRDQLSTSAIPYLRVGIVFLTSMSITIIQYFLERYMRNLFVTIETVRLTKASTEKELERSQTLLENILPLSFIEYAKKLKSGFIQRHDNMTVLFSDLVDFTSFSSTISASKLFALLNRHFQEFDRLSAEFKIEKVKTIGDAYFCVAFNLSNSNERCVTMAYCMIESLKSINQEQNENFQIRIGVSSGTGTLCVLGISKLTFDGFGPAVNEAQILEESCISNGIQVSTSVFKDCTKMFSFDKNPERDTYFLKDCLLENPTSSALAAHLDMTTTTSPKAIEETASNVSEKYVVDYIQKAPEIEKLPPIISMQNCTKFATNMKDPKQINFEKYGEFLKCYKGEEDSSDIVESSIVLPKLSKITTMFKTLRDNKKFWEESYAATTHFTIVIGILNGILCVYTTICAYSSIYFENPSNIQWYYTYGAGLVGLTLYHLIITLIYVIPPIRNSYFLGRLYNLHLFLVNFAFIIVLTFTHELFFKHFGMTHLNMASVFLLAIPIVPLFVKVILLSVILPIPILAIRTILEGFQPTLYINIIPVSAIRVLIAYFFNYTLAKLYLKQKEADLQLLILKRKHQRNQDLLYSSLPPKIVERIHAVSVTSQSENDLEKVDKDPANTSISNITKAVSTEVGPNSFNQDDHLSNASFSMLSSLARSLSKSRARMSDYQNNYSKALICDDIPYTNVMFIKVIMPKEIEESLLAINILNDLFGWFDLISEEFNIVKIKSIGVTYIVMCENPDQLAHASLVYRKISLKLIELYDSINSTCTPSSPSKSTTYKDLSPTPTSPQHLLSPLSPSSSSLTSLKSNIISSISIKIGMQCGTLSAGILGTRKYLYDIFGDTVNVAARMCSLAENNHIQMTKSFSEQLSLPEFIIQKNQPISVKGKGKMITYRLDDDGSLT